MSAPERERIVVGVDGSELSKVALRWAHREAALHGADLDVLHVASPSEDTAEALADTRRLAAVVEQVVGDDASVPVHHHVVEGPPAQALIEAARHADLVVVGSHGHRGYGSLRLGSVSQQVADHAPCPVVVVR